MKLNYIRLIVLSTLAFNMSACNTGNEATGDAVYKAAPDLPMLKVCDKAVLDDALDASKTEELALNCSLQLKSTDKIQRQITFKGDVSDLTLDCGGGKLLLPTKGKYTVAIHSVKNEDGSWAIPHDITIRNCEINGAIRIWGLGENGESTAVKESSRLPDQKHTQRIQDIAPHDILLKNLKIKAIKTTPVYVSPGVTEVRLFDSQITGESTSVAIYLDAESAKNEIVHNLISIDNISEKKPREQIAIDGSAYNIIKNNVLANLITGGIFAYRNCGEGGTVRHQGPQYNTIDHNIFYYTLAGTASFPAIWLGSRDNALARPYYENSYCEMDDGYPFGSSSDNGDFARHNTVVNNQWVNQPELSKLRVDNKPNTDGNNKTLFNVNNYDSAAEFWQKYKFPK